MISAAASAIISRRFPTPAISWRAGRRRRVDLFCAAGGGEIKDCDLESERLSHLGDLRPQCPDQIAALGEVRLLNREDLQKSTFLERDDVEPFTCPASGITDDIDQPIERMQAAEQIIILPIGA